MTFPSDLIEKWLLQADEIERLRGSIADTNVVIEQVSAENERLREALEQIANLRGGYRFPNARDIAREALK